MRCLLILLTFARLAPPRQSLQHGRRRRSRVVGHGPGRFGTSLEGNGACDTQSPGARQTDRCANRRGSRVPRLVGHRRLRRDLLELLPGQPQTIIARATNPRESLELRQARQRLGRVSLRLRGVRRLAGVCRRLPAKSGTRRQRMIRADRFRFTSSKRTTPSPAECAISRRTTSCTFASSESGR